MRIIKARDYDEVSRKAANIIFSVMACLKFKYKFLSTVGYRSALVIDAETLSKIIY